MKTINLTYPHNLNDNELPETVAAIGFFDGIHKGHKTVIESAVQKAKTQGRTSAVITFYPHPSVVLKKDKPHVNYLTPLRDKEEILSEMGVDRLYIITFNQLLSKLEPQQFVDHFIVGLNIKHLVAGFDFSYGHMGKGSVDTIDQHARGRLDFTVISKLEENNEKVSSTFIRHLLDNGEVEHANHLLGRPLAVRGTVIKGDQRGRTIGYPTANIKLSDDYYLPKVGVYAVKVKHQGGTWNGMANLGYKPTFQQKASTPSIEVHILDYNKEIYGEELTVEWFRYIRDEKKFNGIDELVNQIKLDEQKIRTYFN